MTADQPSQTLDLRTTKCPLNFVKTRLALEKLPLHNILEVWIDVQSQSVMNIPSSIRAEGHEVLRQDEAHDETSGEAYLKLRIRRLK